jgi:hypothetical protein
MPAMAKVAASILSGMTVCSAPWSESTPSISIVSVPAPRMRAPMDERRVARSDTSGSRAQFLRTVVPRASEAAMRAFSVPVTVF